MRELLHPDRVQQRISQKKFNCYGLKEYSITCSGLYFFVRLNLKLHVSVVDVIFCFEGAYMFFA